MSLVCCKNIAKQLIDTDIHLNKRLVVEIIQ